MQAKSQPSRFRVAAVVGGVTLFLYTVVIDRPVEAFSTSFQTSSWPNTRHSSFRSTTTRPQRTISQPTGNEDRNRMRLQSMTTPEVDEADTASLATNPALDQALEQGNLRQAVTALKQQPNDQQELSRTQFGQIFDLIEERTAAAQENDTENLRALAEFPLTSTARDEMTDMYQTLREQGHLSLFGAMQAQEPLAATASQNGQVTSHTSRTLIPPTLLEGILDLPMKALTPQPTNSLLLAGTVVALLEGVVSAAFGIPMSALFLASLFVVSVDRLFLNGASFESFLKIFSPGVQDKILRHEAGHFLAAYLLGCPVEGIVLSAWAALQDQRFGGSLGRRGGPVSAGTSFFDPQLSQQINQRQQVTQSAVDRYSIIVMAGIAAEADGYGRADGGAGDEMSLIAFLSQLNLNRGNPQQQQWNYDSIRNQARWGALQAVLLLREYQPAYAALVDALERGGTLGDCIYAIESAARKHNLTPVQHPLGYIVAETNNQPTELLSAVVEDPTMTTTTTTRVVWKPYQPNNDTNHQNDTEVTGEPTESTTTKAEPMDQETMATTLQEYRAQVEAKLKTVQQQLDELEQQQ